MPIMWSDRDQFIAAHVTQETKDKLRQASKEERKSMSEIISEALEARLKKREAA
jgi:hypothetical protein